MGNLITMPGNKLSNERINAAKAMQGHHEAIAAFDALYARWLAAWANTVKPIKRKSENNLDAEVDKLDDLTWELALPQRRVTAPVLSLCGVGFGRIPVHARSTKSSMTDTARSSC